MATDAQLFPLEQENQDDSLIDIFDRNGLQDLEIKPNKVTPMPPKAAKVPPYNIYDGLNHLDKIKMRHELAQTSITPFDKVEYI